MKTRWTNTGTALSRRDALRLLGASTASVSILGCGSGGTDEEPGLRERLPRPNETWAGTGPGNLAAFPIGVQSGDARPTEVILCTRMSAPGSATLVVSRWNGTLWEDHDSETVMSDEAGYIHVSLEDQTPDAVIAYQFVDNQNRKSPVGMCRLALPAGHTGNIQFGVSSCTKLPWAPFPALSELAAYPLDFCVLLGDSSYNDNAVTLQEYRDCWSDALSSQGYLDLLQNAAIVATWDDHEVVNNWDRETIDSARLQAGTQAFFENLAIRPSEQSEFGLWRRLKWGETAEFFILDCRGERFPSRKEYISPAQMNWLKEGLCSSTATWKVVVNSVPIANMPLVFDVEVAIRDRWEGFKAQRDELLTHIEECSVSGVLFLGGDLHMSALTRVEEVGFMRNVFELIVGPGGQRGNVLGALIGGNEQFPYSGSEICTAAVELSASGTAATRWIGENGQIIAECLFTSEGELLDLQVPIPEE